MNIVDYLQIQSLRDIKRQKFHRMIIRKRIMLIGYAEFFEINKYHFISILIFFLFNSNTYFILNKSKYIK